MFTQKSNAKCPLKLIMKIIFMGSGAQPRGTKAVCMLTARHLQVCNVIHEKKNLRMKSSIRHDFIDLR